VPRRDRTDFIGIGTGACSQIGDVLCRLDDNVPRWQAKLASGHIGVVAGLIQSSQEALASEVVQQIACNHTLDIDEFEWRNAVAFSACFADSIARLQPFLARGWARWEGRILRLEPEGILLWRMMAACFRPVTTASAGLP
jgi:coproporphyrinogen III oxidase-like Fe-S oxidoreductase